MTSRYWDEATGGVVHYVHPSQGSEPSRSSGYDSDDSEASSGSMTTIGSDEAGGEHSTSRHGQTLTRSLEYFREVFGRRFPAQDGLPLTYPVDNEELLRLDLQHASLKLLMEGNQWRPIIEALAPTRGRRRRVLDIFTRSGTWCVCHLVWYTRS